MSINLETSWSIWPIIVYALLSMAIVMIRVSNGMFEIIGYRIISTFASLAILYILYSNLVP